MEGVAVVEEIEEVEEEEEGVDEWRLLGGCSRGVTA